MQRLHHELGNDRTRFQTSENSEARTHEVLPANPLFEVLANGASSRAIELTRSTCPGTSSKYGDDIFWQRELFQNDLGEVEIVRDWGAPHTLARETANGHDCIFLINLLLNPG